MRAEGDKRRTRAAANSIARGRPSRRARIDATAGAFPVVNATPGRAAVARSTKSRTVGF